MPDKREVSSYWSLRIALGVVPILAGLDKFTNLLTHWDGYLGLLTTRLLPVSPVVSLRAAGLVEVVVGAGILLGHARIFGWIAMGWLAAIAFQLVASGIFLDVAARDLVLAASAFALARLAEIVEAPRPERSAQASSTARARA